MKNIKFELRNGRWTNSLLNDHKPKGYGYGAVAQNALIREFGRILKSHEDFYMGMDGKLNALMDVATRLDIFRKSLGWCSLTWEELMTRAGEA